MQQLAHGLASSEQADKLLMGGGEEVRDDGGEGS